VEDRPKTNVVKKRSHTREGGKRRNLMVNMVDERVIIKFLNLSKSP
jgi:hypothetical protein